MISFRKQLLIPLLLLFMSTVSVLPGFSEQTEKVQNHSKIQLEFVASEPCALVMFINILAERHQTSQWVKVWYEQKCKTTAAFNRNIEQDKTHINAYKALINREDKHFKFVDDIGQMRSIDEMILCEAARSNYIPELLTRLKEKLPNDELTALRDVLYYFGPIYHELIWKPRKIGLGKQLQEFREQTVNTKMCERLTQVKHFLNSPWSGEKPFIIALSPLPINGRGTHGQSMGIVQTVELKPSDRFAKTADVVFHEAVHALWFAKKDANEAMKFFTLPDKRVLPLTELYEGMATALGQGWFAKEAFGKTETNWYADPIINRYSQVVYPLYADYLKRGRKLDAAFGKEATAVYFRMYPDASQRVNLTSCYLVIADEMKDFAGFRAELFKTMPRLRECSISTPANSKEAFKAFEESHAERAAVLTSADKLIELKTLGISDSQIDLLKKRTGSASTILLKGKRTLFCLAETSEGQKKIFLDLLKVGRWPAQDSL